MRSTYGQITLHCATISMLMLFTQGACVAQLQQDEKLLHASFSYAINTFPADQKMLYNGPVYLRAHVVAGGHPYFLTDSYQPGTVLFGRNQYDGIDIIYDASRDLLAIEDNLGNRICPVADKVSAFVLQGHVFKRLQDIQGLPKGYYDELVNNTVSLYAARQKKIKGLQWKQVSHYYVVTDKKATAVDSKKDLLKILPEGPKEGRVYLRKHHLTFRKHKEESLIKVVQSWVSLKE